MPYSSELNAHVGSKPRAWGRWGGSNEIGTVGSSVSRSQLDTQLSYVVRPYSYLIRYEAPGDDATFPPPFPIIIPSTL